MMKKLLVLALVLGIAGFASAGLSLTKSADGKVASLASDVATTVGANYYLTVAKSLTATIALTAAGNPTGGSTIGAAEDYADAFNWYFLTIITTDGTKPMLAGNWLTVTATAGTPGDVQLWDSSGMQAVTPAVTLVPEPMTMILLGLGGLFLRRK